MEKRLHPRLKAFLDKSLFDYQKGHKKAINFESKGQRFYGDQFESFEVKDGKVHFVIDGKGYEFNLLDIYRFKRLRSKKYLFLVKEAGEIKEMEDAPKPKKKAPAKKKAEKEEEKLDSDSE